jgi:TolB protein
VRDNAEGNDGNDSLKLIRPDGSGLVTLLNRPALDDPAMSPGGTKVAYTGGNKRNAEIYMINISNGHVRQLTNNAFDDSDPTWSPDGTKTVFQGITYQGRPNCEWSVKIHIR